MRRRGKWENRWEGEGRKVLYALALETVLAGGRYQFCQPVAGGAYLHACLNLPTGDLIVADSIHTHSQQIIVG